MAALVPSSGGLLNVPAGGGTAILIDGDSCYVDNVYLLGFRNSIAAVPEKAGGTASVGDPRIGWVKGDMANGFRFDQTGGGGRVSGPFTQDGALTQGYGNSPSEDPTNSNLIGTVTGDSNSSTLIVSNSTSLGGPSIYAPNMPLTVILVQNSAVGSGSGAAIFSPYNTSNTNAAGVATNRFNAVVQ